MSTLAAEARPKARPRRGRLLTGIDHLTASKVAQPRLFTDRLPLGPSSPQPGPRMMRSLLTRLRPPAAGRRLRGPPCPTHGAVHGAEGQGADSAGQSSGGAEGRLAPPAQWTCTVLFQRLGVAIANRLIILAREKARMRRRCSRGCKARRTHYLSRGANPCVFPCLF